MLLLLLGIHGLWPWYCQGPKLSVLVLTFDFSVKTVKYAYMRLVFY